MSGLQQSGNRGDGLNRISAHIEAMPVADMQEAYECAKCEDRGMVVREVNGKRLASRCQCMYKKAAQRRVDNARIPAKYMESRFKNFDARGKDPSVAMALRTCQTMAETFISSLGPQGLLLTGTCGVGKTHLAAATLRYTLDAYGIRGRFWDMADLLTQLKRSFSRKQDPDSDVSSESALVEEFASLDVLVIDELGGERLTDWSYSEVSLLLNARYNSQGDKPKLTIFTTNFENLGPGALRGGETLGDRIGARIFSRLQEMCRPVPMTGEDFRMRRHG